MQLLPCPHMQYLKPWNGRGIEAYFLLVCIRAAGAPSLQSDAPRTAEAAPRICDAARLPGARGSIEAEIISVRRSDPGHLFWKQNPGVKLQRGRGGRSRMDAFARRVLMKRRLALHAPYVPAWQLNNELVSRMTTLCRSQAPTRSTAKALFCFCLFCFLWVLL